jgi:thiamine-monophosphate kinase
MNERELVRRIAKQAKPAPHIVRGIGEDCAVLRVPPGTELLVKADQFVEGVHFTRKTAPPSALGQRAVARALSDIAAMGGEPLACFLSIALPEWACGHWVNDFYRGVAKAGVPLAGGDTTRARTFYCDAIVAGAVKAGEALRRDTAREGDAVYVSGVLGIEAARKRVIFEPRLALGRYLRENRIATACMDISDGLALDLSRLAGESGLAATIDAEPPIANGVSAERAMTYGEDYELLFTAAPGTAVPATFNGIPLTRIGRMRRGRPGEVKFRGRLLKPRGWDPFSK